MQQKKKKKIFWRTRRKEDFFFLLPVNLSCCKAGPKVDKSELLFFCLTLILLRR